MSDVEGRPRLRPGYVLGVANLHHFVIVPGEDTAVFDDNGERRALCGALIDGIDEARPLWKAGGEPCAHCSKVFDSAGFDRSDGNELGGADG